MAFTDSNNGMVMPVTPMYGGGNNGGFGGGFGGDWGWIILLLLFAGGGWGMGGFGGAGNMMLGYDFPWLLNGQNNIKQIQMADSEMQCLMMALLLSVMVLVDCLRSFVAAVQI